MSNVQGAMSNELKTEEHVVAFIDVLGATAMIHKDADASLNLVHSVYSKSIEIFKQLMQLSSTLDITIFSDNIIVSGKVPSEKAFAAIFKAVNTMSAIIQGNFLFSGQLVRGGIASGSFFKDDIMVWGEALIKAYEIESKVAIYPRIVVDPDTIGRLGYYSDESKQKDFWLQGDNDGVLFVDYLQEKYIKDYELLLLRELEKYDERIIDCRNETTIMQKNNWHLNYVKSKLLHEAKHERDEGQ